MLFILKKYYKLFICKIEYSLHENLMCSMMQ